MNEFTNALNLNLAKFYTPALKEHVSRLLSLPLAPVLFQSIISFLTLNCFCNLSHVSLQCTQMSLVVYSVAFCLVYFLTMGLRLD